MRNLERHVPVELCIPGLIDLAHPTLADEGGDLAVAEGGAVVLPRFHVGTRS